MPEITVLKNRADFLLAAGSGFKYVKNTVIVQARKRTADAITPDEIRVGFTATKKLGNAVIRNRTKRRMRAAAMKLLPEFGISGCDYVLVGRMQTYKGDFTLLLSELRICLKQLAAQIA